VEHIARKRFGQNFLVDKSIINQIIHLAAPRKDDVVVEIGPGLGALTKPLLDVLPHLHVVEIDRDIIAKLKTWPQEKLSIHAIDALKFDFASVGKNIRVIGNLPYNISTPLLFHLIQFREQIQDMHFMLQKEVVERMVAAPSTGDYGRLSVMIQYFFEIEKILDVPPEAFRPAPKVFSAVVNMVPIKQRSIKAKDEKLFARLVHDAFMQRRKTLRNALHAHLTAEDFDRLNVVSSLRPENLSLENFITLANYLTEKNIRPD
jgi:16S rRNA (adenine1518-N6/adenine1519-N6)-dimethyltransferase